jgi:hypothetical protein
MNQRHHATLATVFFRLHTSSLAHVTDGLPCLRFQHSLDIPVLRTFVSSNQKHRYPVATLHEIHSISGVAVDTQLAGSLAHWFHITRVAQRQAADARIDACLGLASHKRLNHAASSSGWRLRQGEEKRQQRNA